MFIIMSYDINEKRVKKAHNITQKYLSPVQRSLFQGFLTEKKLNRLKNELSLFLLPEEDKVVFYKSFDDTRLMIEQFGTATDTEMIL